MTDTDSITAGLVIHPGDNVLLTMARDDLDPDEAERVLSELADRFPGVTFTIAGGVTSLAKATP